MTRTRHLLATAVLVAMAAPAAAQTLIGTDDQPSVEVNLDVLNSLGPSTGGTADLYGGATTQPQADTGGSVLLIAPPSGSSMPSDSSGDSVILLDEPATTTTTTTEVFVFPEVPEAKPATPEAEATETLSETVSMSESAGTTTTTTTTVVEETPPAPEPEPEIAAGTATTDAGVGAMDDDAFSQLDTMLEETVQPEEITVPEPEMEMEGSEVAALSPPTELLDAGVSLQIVFEPGSEDMTDADRSTLDGLAAQLDSSPDQRIQLRAYASSDDGTASAARRLALARALQVRAYLIENGVRSTRIDVRALGDKDEGTGPRDRIDIVLVES